MIIFDNLSMWLVAFSFGVVFFSGCVCVGGILYLHFGLGLLGPLVGRVTTNYSN